LKENLENFLVVELEFSNYYSTNICQTYQPKPKNFSSYCIFQLNTLQIFQVSQMQQE
jgi:hypothetical protein